MSELLTSGQTGTIDMERMKEIRERIVEKWSSLGLLEGLTGLSEEKKRTIAQLYESQASHLLNETTTPISGDTFDSVQFPIIKRNFP